MSDTSEAAGSMDFMQISVAAQEGEGQPSHAVGSAEEIGTTITPRRNGEQRRLEGNPPETFNGDRNQSDKFLRQYELYYMLNEDTQQMKNPYNRVIMGLSFMRGQKIDDWVDGQISDVRVKKLSRGADDESIWTEFVEDFKMAFTDTAKKEDAYQKLHDLKMKGEDIDTYNATFDNLCKRAKWDQDHPGVVDLYRAGLRVGTLNAILGRDVWPETLNEWQLAARNEIRKYLIKRMLLPPRGGARAAFGNRGQWQQAFGHRGPSQGGSRPRDPNAMDVDTTQIDATYTEEQKQLMKEGRCFFCKKQGHLRRSCPDQRRRAQQKPTEARETTAEVKPIDEKAAARKALKALKDKGNEADIESFINEIVEEGF